MEKFKENLGEINYSPNENFEGLKSDAEGLKDKVEELKDKAEELKGQADKLKEKAEVLEGQNKDKPEEIKDKIGESSEKLAGEVPNLENIEKSPAWVRLEAQIKWYELNSGKNKKTHKVMQFFQITMAISIPAIVHIELPITKWVISILGALIAVFESVQYMNQYEAIWTAHREIAERLRREKFLFLASAGPYKGLSESESLKHLAERVEELVSIGSTNETNESSGF